MKSAVFILYTLLPMKASTEPQMVDDDDDEVGLLQLHHSTYSTSQVPVISHFTWAGMGNPATQDFDWELGPHDDGVFGGSLGPDCWRMTATPDSLTSNPITRYIRGKAVSDNPIWTVDSPSVEVPSGERVHDPSCFLDRSTPSTSAPQRWCAESGKQCQDGAYCGTQTPGQCSTPTTGLGCNERPDGSGCTEHMDGAYPILEDGSFAAWGHCASHPVPSVNAEHVGSCDDICTEQGNPHRIPCLSVCSCISLLDQSEFLIDSGICANYGGVSITDPVQCIQAARTPGFGITPMHAVPSNPIDPTVAAYGCIFDDDASQITGENLWLGLHWRADHGMPSGTNRKQICTPKVAKVPGPCSSDWMRTYKPILNTEDCTKAAQMLSSSRTPISPYFDGDECWVDANSRAIGDLQLCTAF